MAAMKQAITGVTSGSRSAEFWRQLMKKWEASGESQRTIAEAAGVSVHTFQYWRAKLQAANNAEFALTSQSNLWTLHLLA